MEAPVTQTKDTQSALTPDAVVNILKEGNQRFVNKNPFSRDYEAQIAATTKGQYPFAAILSCIDSRVPVELIFDQGIGDVFSARVAGNITSPDILGSIEYACAVAGSKTVMVLGHTNCGAVKGACDDVDLGNITHLINKLKPSVAAVDTPEGTDRSSANATFVNEVVDKNVEVMIENIRKESPLLKELEADGKINIVGAVYDVATGKVMFK